MSSFTFPSLHKHVASGRAVVTVRLSNGGRRDFYCGSFCSAEAKAEYRRICDMLIRNDGTYPAGDADLTIAEAMVKYLRHAEVYYGKGGNSSLVHVKHTMRTLCELFDDINVVDFGPKSLRSCQDRWIAEGFVRKSINK